MPTFTLPDLPDDLRRRLQRRAEQNRRPLDREVIETLRHALEADPPAGDQDGAWDRAVALRDRLAGVGVSLTGDEIDRAIAEGRA